MVLVDVVHVPGADGVHHGCLAWTDEVINERVMCMHTRSQQKVKLALYA